MPSSRQTRRCSLTATRPHVSPARCSRCRSPVALFTPFRRLSPLTRVVVDRGRAARRARRRRCRGRRRPRRAPLFDDDIGDANSDIYIDDDDDENNADVTTADDDNDNDDAGFSLARLAADHVRLPAPQHGGDDDDDASSEGPSRVFKAPKSALIALLNSVSAVAPSASYDGRVGDLRESDIAYLEQFQEQSAVVSKILLSSAKLPPVKSKVRLPPSRAQQLRQPYSVQAPPISIDSRVAPSQYQEIPPLAQLKKQPPLPAKLSRREYADLSGDAAATSKTVCSQNGRLTLAVGADAGCAAKVALVLADDDCGAVFEVLRADRRTSATARIVACTGAAGQVDSVWQLQVADHSAAAAAADVRRVPAATTGDACAHVGQRWRQRHGGVAVPTLLRACGASAGHGGGGLADAGRQ
jgi:hypothetical protein